MILSGRRLLIGLLLVLAACASVVWLPGGRWLVIVVGLLGVGASLLLSAYRTPLRGGTAEPDEIGELPPQRRAELIRGTSKFLREMGYRYSVRVDANPSGVRQCFSAEVNDLKLGFVPAVVTDNDNDRQGYGYVAFVYDQQRWRGPGLPCPAGRSEAVEHAARCVSPLDDPGAEPS
ncbi:MAG: hypothetical protein ACYTJ0_04340 [Planctomycetota bacterium]|jgi:hypothetical protein